jgi:Tol biopolymer transport system component
MKDGNDRRLKWREPIPSLPPTSHRGGVVSAGGRLAPVAAERLSARRSKLFEGRSMRMIMTKMRWACVVLAAVAGITIGAQSGPARAQDVRQVGQRADTPALSEGYRYPSTKSVLSTVRSFDRLRTNGVERFRMTGVKGPSAKLRVLFNRYQVPVMTVFIADADGQNERPLVPPSPALRVSSPPAAERVGVRGTHAFAYSPSYSADGHWVVFTAERDGQADIYRIHPDGAGLQQLTDDPAFDDQGALSPDGKMLAFVSTRGGGTANIWLMDLSSKTYTNLTKHHSGNFRPSWSPDGRWIAFTSDRDSQPGLNPGMWEHLQSTGVYVIKPDGKDLRRLTRNDGVAGSPSWSADGHKVVFYETDEVGAYLAKSGQSRTEIVSIDVTTGERKQYTASNETKLSPRWLSDGRISYIKRAGDDTSGLRIWHPSRRVDTVIRGAVRNASWSPDGKSVVYERISRLGSTQHLVPTFSPDADFELFLNEPFPFFSPDGTKLLYSQYGLGKSATTGLEFSSPQNTSIEIMNLSGTDKHTLFHREGFSAFSGEWSPAGDEIVLAIGRYFRAPGLPPAQIGLVKPDGSNFRLIVDDGMNNGFPSWSPDGTRLVFKRGRHLVIMSLADRTITPLTDGDHYNNFPQWSPKSDAIMFTSDRDGDFDLYTIRPDGTQLRRLTNVRGNDAHAAWCSGGDWVVFSSARMGFKDEMALYDAVPQPYGEIFAMRADGSDVRQLTDNKWEDSGAVCSPEPLAEAAKPEAK